MHLSVLHWMITTTTTTMTTTAKTTTKMTVLMSYPHWLGLAIWLASLAFDWTHPLPSSHILDQPFFLFQVISFSITLHIRELMSPCMTWPHHHRQVWIFISYYNIFTATLTLSWRTLVDTQSTSLIPHIILIIQHSTPCNHASSATVSSQVPKQHNKTGLTQKW